MITDITLKIPLLSMKKLFKRKIKPKYIDNRNKRTIVKRSDIIKGKPKVKRSRIPIQKKQEQSKHIKYMSKIPNKTSDKVFIIGGGPSAKVVDFKKLERNGNDIICVNKSIEHVSHAKFFITMDYTFFRKTRMSLSDINARVEQSLFVLNKENTHIEEIGGVITDTKFNIPYDQLNYLDSVIISNKETNPGFSTNLSDFAHGNNSGYCALQLAILMKYKEIHLIGFDLIPRDNITHFHNGYNQNKKVFQQNLEKYRDRIISDIKLYNNDNIFVSTRSTALKNVVKYKGLDRVYNSENKKPAANKNLDHLMVIAYYTINTPYEAEANKLIKSLKRLGINYDVVGVKNLGNWQANTRFKAKFMEDMLNKHHDKNLLYVDSDAIMHSKPILFQNYRCDVAVRWQDFRWRKNECLSGTIYMANNERSRELCKRWQSINVNEGPNAKTFEQWNLGTVIQDMRNEGRLRDKNLPPEYTFIFDSMRKMYPDAKPVIEHFQASRKLRNKV